MAGAREMERYGRRGGREGRGEGRGEGNVLLNEGALLHWPTPPPRPTSRHSEFKSAHKNHTFDGMGCACIPLPSGKSTMKSMQTDHRQ